MPPVIWESNAEQQFLDALDYIAERNSNAAERLEETVRRSVARLSDLPFIGRPGRVGQTRELIVHPNYIVIYQATAERVAILRFLHARQRYP